MMSNDTSRKYAREGRLTYGVIGLVNICVVVMFVAILSPEKMYVSSQAPLNVVSEHVSSSEFLKINIGIPNRIVVPSIGIDLPVKTGSYDQINQTWTSDIQSAFYADRTVPVNDSNGSTLIYGHARDGIFSRLPEITEGATAQVYTDSGKIFSYSFASSREVAPDDTSIFVNVGEPILTLQTCSGPFDMYRTLVSFNLSGVSSV